MKVYVLQHEHDLDGDATDVKMVGVYATEADALAAQERMSAAPGFRDHREGFSVDAYEVGQDHWQDGFQTKRSRTSRSGEYIRKPMQVRRLSAKG
jgi:hypothetical protein